MYGISWPGCWSAFRSVANVGVTIERSSLVFIGVRFFSSARPESQAADNEKDTWLRNQTSAQDQGCNDQNGDAFACAHAERNRRYVRRTHERRNSTDNAMPLSIVQRPDRGRRTSSTRRGPSTTISLATKPRCRETTYQARQEKADRRFGRGCTVCDIASANAAETRLLPATSVRTRSTTRKPTPEGSAPVMLTCV